MADETPHQVSLFHDASRKIYRWRRLAEELNCQEWFIRAMEHIARQLRNHPTTWGDPQYSYSHARLRVFQGNHENFIVVYAVHMDRPIVFLRDVRLLDKSPFHRR